ncbi:PKD2 [Symbiodinium natans]|uniref:PKD2 protein n=1 Tax=Symbiodinium natans TaxID=878477 RepID=A0A812PZQ8_9DINO|nr:PKD2 [Symbiodinium natans]
MMKRAISGALLVGCTLKASASSVAAPGCTCMSHGQMLEMVGGVQKVQASVGGSDVMYPASYGNYCGKQSEPGASACFNLTSGEELPASEQAGWCNDPWCYVDPCTCPVADLALTSYFPGSKLYYSYSNCGGVDTFSSSSSLNVDAGCAANYTPVTTGTCLLKMSSGQPKVDCTTAFAKEGKCVMATPGGPNTTATQYPPTYGEGCGVHLEPGSSSCSDSSGNPLPLNESAGWCTKPWSYVNPCECSASDMTRSTYFDLELYYSYSVCGATDTYTENPSAVTINKTSVGCPSPPPPAVSPMNWPFTSALEEGCECIPLADMYLMSSTDASCAQGTGKCANASSGMLTANYGGSCGIHAELFSSSCYDQDTGKMWADQCEEGWSVGCRAAWCDRPWCYVNPCTCSSVSDIAASLYFPGSTLYYSYANCKSIDTFTPGGSSVDIASICPTTTGSDEASGSQALGVVAFLATAVVTLLTC